MVRTGAPSHAVELVVVDAEGRILQNSREKAKARGCSASCRRFARSIGARGARWRRCRSCLSSCVLPPARLLCRRGRGCPFGASVAVYCDFGLPHVDEKALLAGHLLLPCVLSSRGASWSSCRSSSRYLAEVARSVAAVQRYRPIGVRDRLCPWSLRGAALGVAGRIASPGLCRLAVRGVAGHSLSMRLGG